MFKELLKSVKTNKMSASFLKVLALDILSKGFPYLLLPVYLNLMSEEEFGLYSYCTFIVLSIAPMMNMGQDTAISRLFFEGDKSYQGKLLFNVGVVLLSIWILISVFLFGFNLDEVISNFLFSGQDLETNFPFHFIFIFILVQASITLLNYIYQIQEKIILYQCFNLVKTVAGGLLMLGLMWHLQDFTAIFRISIEPFIYLLVFTPLIFIVLRSMLPKWQPALIRRSMKIGLPLMFSALVGVIYNLVDKYFIQDLYGYEELAPYNFALLVALPLTLIFSSFNVLWIPMFFKEKNIVVNFYRTQKTFFLIAAALVGLGFVIWVALYACFFFETGIFPEAYAVTLYILPLILLSRTIEVCSQLFMNFTVIKENTAYNVKVMVMVATVAIGLNYFLISEYKITGALIAMFFIAIVRFNAFYWYARKVSLA